MPEEFIPRIEYEKRHDELAKRVDRVEIRVEKVETTLDAKDAESQKVHADIRREQTETYLKLLDAVHGVKDEVAKDRLATLSIEATLRGEMARNTTAQAAASNKNLRWVIALIVALLSGSGFVELGRVLLTGKP